MSLKLIRQTRMKRVRTLSSDSGCDLQELRNEEFVENILDKTKVSLISMMEDFVSEKLFMIKQSILKESTGKVLL